MGRTPKSAEEHKKDGTYRKCRHEGLGFNMDALIEIETPDSLTDAAKSKWGEVIPALAEKGLISIVDLPELIDAFEHYGIAQECINFVKANYPTFGDYLANINVCKGQINLLETYSKEMERYNRTMHRFGVTPIDRAKIKLPSKKIDKDAEGRELLEELIANR